MVNLLPSRLAPAEPSRSGRSKAILLLQYLPDWVATIGLVGVTTWLTAKAGHQREFSLTDTSLQHTFAVKERVTFQEDLLYAGVIPLVVVLLYGGLRRSFWDCHNAALGLILGASLATAATNIIKVMVGRPRPDVIDRCQPLAGSVNGSPYGLANTTICTQAALLVDGFKSFPSGHTSFAFAGLGFLSLYFAGKLRLFHFGQSAIKAWFSLTPIFCAALIGITRTMDNRHHATDVLAGALLGTFMAVFSYHLYYPPLSSPHCQLPFSPPARPADGATRPVSTTAGHQNTTDPELYHPGADAAFSDSDERHELGTAPRHPRANRSGYREVYDRD